MIKAAVKAADTTKLNAVRNIMSIETGSAVSKQKLDDLRTRMLALKEHL